MTSTAHPLSLPTVLTEPALATTAPTTHTPSNPSDPSSPPTGSEGGGSALLVVLVVLAAALYGFGYFLSIRIHPYKACRRCEGAGKHRGSVFNRAFRACDRCGGTGREHRTFAKAPYKQNDTKRRGQ